MGLIKTTLTIDGINKLNASLMDGTPLIPKFFKFSNQEYVLDTTTTKDFIGWIEKDIDLFQQIDNNIEFTCIVPQETATDYLKSVGIFLEDGTLFLFGTLPNTFPPNTRQMVRIQISLDTKANLDFKYIPIDKMEEGLLSLNNLAILGNRITKNTAIINNIYLPNGGSED